MNIVELGEILAMHDCRLVGPGLGREDSSTSITPKGPITGHAYMVETVATFVREARRVGIVVTERDGTVREWTTDIDIARAAAALVTAIGEPQPYPGRTDSW